MEQRRFLQRSRGGLTVIAACLWFAAAAPAGAVETLLKPLLPELMLPQNRCAAETPDVPDLERTLSLHRETLVRVTVDVGGRPLGDTLSGAIGGLVFEQRLIGPDTVMVQVDRGGFVPAAGDRLEVAGIDRTGERHPLFCGFVGHVQGATGRGAMDILAFRPRPGLEHQRSRQFQHMSRVEVVEAVAGEAGLAIQIEDTQSRPTLPHVAQNQEADWLFVRRLAAEDKLELTLTPESGLRLIESSFTPPDAFPPRPFTDMSWLEVVATLAEEVGLMPDIQEQASFPPVSFQQNESNLRFAHDLGVSYERSVYLLGANGLRVRDDGVWRRNPALRSATYRLPPAELAAEIAQRHRLTLETQGMPRGVAGQRQQGQRLIQRQQSDSEFLLAVLARSGLRLEPGSNGLRLRAAAAPGDAADLVRLRAVISTGGRAAALTRTYGDVRAQLLQPESVASTRLHLQLAARPALRFSPARAPVSQMPSPNGSLMMAGDVTPAAVAVDGTLARHRRLAGNDPVRRFLGEVATVYRPTLIFLARQAHAGK